MRSSRAMAVSLALVVMLALGVTDAATAQSAHDYPNAEARLWCASHIEEFYQELRAQDVDVRPEPPDWVANALDYWERRVPDTVFKDFVDWLGTQIFDMDEVDPESEIMRRVAYGILKNWPFAEPDAGFSAMAVAFNDFGEPNEYASGRHLLRAMWRVWKKERNALLRNLFAVSGADSYDPVVSASGTFGREYAKWTRRWGPDPDMLPATVPDGYLPSDLDCKWYMAVDYGSDSDADEGLRFLAVFVHEGHLLEPWNNGNTKVISHFAATGTTQQAPYPTEMDFAFPYGQKQPYFTEDVYYYTRRLYNWLPMEPRESKTFLIRPTAEQSPIRYDFRYPIWDSEHNVRRFGRAVITSHPGPEFKRALARLIEIKGNPMHEGERLRAWAGEYTPEGALEGQR